MKYKYNVYIWCTMLEEWDLIECFEHKCDADDFAYNISLDEGVKTKIKRV